MDTHKPAQETVPYPIYLYPRTQKPDHLEQLAAVPEGTYPQLMAWLSTTTVPEQLSALYKGDEHEARLAMLTEAGHLKRQLDLCATPDRVELIQQVFPDGMTFNLKEEQLIPFSQLYALLAYGWGDITEQGWGLIQELGLGESHSPGECVTYPEAGIILYSCDVNITALKHTRLMGGVIWRPPLTVLATAQLH